MHIIYSYIRCPCPDPGSSVETLPDQWQPSAWHGEEPLHRIALGRARVISHDTIDSGNDDVKGRRWKNRDRQWKALVCYGTQVTHPFEFSHNTFIRLCTNASTPSDWTKQRKQRSNPRSVNTFALTKRKQNTQMDRKTIAHRRR
jgi:hypothetical protein